MLRDGEHYKEEERDRGASRKKEQLRDDVMALREGILMGNIQCTEHMKKSQGRWCQKGLQAKGWRPWESILDTEPWDLWHPHHCVIRKTLHQLDGTVRQWTIILRWLQPSVPPMRTMRQLHADIQSLPPCRRHSSSLSYSDSLNRSGCNFF